MAVDIGSLWVSNALTIVFSSWLNHYAPQLIYLPALLNLQDSDQLCKSFKRLDGRTCRHGVETAPIVIAKFTRLKAEAAIAENNETEAHALLTEAL